MKTKNNISFFKKPIITAIFLAVTISICAHSQTDASQPMRVKSKANQLVMKVQQIQKDGGNPMPLVTVAKKVKELADQGKLNEAEALLDHTLDKTPTSETSTAEVSADDDTTIPHPINPPYTRLFITGETAVSGIYDPALTYDGNTGWLSYTAIDIQRRYHHTHIANSTDFGKTWNQVTTVFQGHDDTIKMPNGTALQGRWNYEVSTIVKDVNDKEKPWKVFAHKYFNTAQPPDVQPIPFSFTTVMKEAPNPTGPWSDEIPLFAAGPIRQPVFGPYKFDLNKIINRPSIQAYSEPGALFYNGAIYLVLSALEDSGKEVHIVLIRSQDHGKTWNFVNILAENKDAAATGDRTFDGTSLFAEDGRVFLLATRVNSRRKPNVKYDGTYVIPFSSIEKGELARDTKGNLAICLLVLPNDQINSGTHGAGQSTYHTKNSNGGLIFPQVDFNNFPQFARIFNTGLYPIASRCK